MKSTLGPSLVAAIRDAGIADGERGLMPLADARPLPFDLQFVAALGDAAFDAWEAQEIPEADRVWFASELALLGSPRTQALAASLQSPS